MSNIPTYTYILDAVGIFGIIVGGYVASKSKYSQENSKEAAALIDTLIKAKELQAQEINELKNDRVKIRADLNQMKGKLESYKELQTVPSDVISKLLETQNIILQAITTSGDKVIKAGQNG